MKPNEKEAMVVKAFTMEELRFLQVFLNEMPKNTSYNNIISVILTKIKAAMSKPKDTLLDRDISSMRHLVSKDGSIDLVKNNSSSMPIFKFMKLPTDTPLDLDSVVPYNLRSSKGMPNFNGAYVTRDLSIEASHSFTKLILKFKVHDPKLKPDNGYVEQTPVTILLSPAEFHTLVAYRMYMDGYLSGDLLGGNLQDLVSGKSSLEGKS